MSDRFGRKLLAFSSLLLGLLAFGPSAWAAKPECQVVNLAPKKTTYNSNSYENPLGVAIAEAQPGDTLQVIGTCSGIFEIKKDLILTGRPSDKHEDYLDGQRSDSVLTVDPGVSLVLFNLTIMNGDADYCCGGGILNRGATTLNDVNVRDNQAEFGAGIYNTGTLVMNDNASVHHNNGSYGGGIHNRGTLTMNDNTSVHHNNGGEGGGIYNLGPSTVTLFGDSQISSNTANSGGGIYNRHDASRPANVVLYDRAAVIDNLSSFTGGGIHNWASSVILNDSATVTGNTANTNGGGVWDVLGQVTLNDGSSISGNLAAGNFACTNCPTGQGGGVGTRGGTVTLTDASTITGNTAATYGGGIYHESPATVSVYDVTSVTGNTAGIDGDNIYPPLQ